MRRISLILIIVVAILLLPNSYAYKAVVDGQVVDDFSAQQFSKTINSDSTGVIYNGQAPDRLRLDGIFSKSNFKGDHLSKIDLEPTTIILLGIGLVGVIACQRRKTR